MSRYIPQNTGTILRLCACLGIEVHIIERPAFPLPIRAFRRAGMDYLDQVEIMRHASWVAFERWRLEARSRLILFTTRASLSLPRPRLPGGRCPSVGARVLGVPNAVHEAADARLLVRCAMACARSMWRWWRHRGRRSAANRLDRARADGRSQGTCQPWDLQPSPAIVLAAGGCT